MKFGIIADTVVRFFNRILDLTRIVFAWSAKGDPGLDFGQQKRP